MTRAGWLLCGLLLALAIVLAALTDEGQSAPSPYPSIHNPGPKGLKALHTYLQETGHAVTELEAPLTSLPPGTRTLVIAQPDGRDISRDEADAVKAFLHAGGRLVYLAPEQRGQRAMSELLSLYSDGLDLPPSAFLSDTAGATATVLALKRLEGVQTLRVGGAGGIGSNLHRALPLATVSGIPVALYLPFGAGEAFIFPDASVAQNALLDGGDNLALWEVLTEGGRTVFAEKHQRPAASHGLPASLLWIGGQLLLIGALFAVAAGARLGPPRGAEPPAQRSAVDYVQSLAALAQTSRLESALLASARHRLRLLLHDRLGISPELPEAELPAVIAEQTGIPATRVQALLSAMRRSEEVGVSPADYHALSVELARLERELIGRRA